MYASPRSAPPGHPLAFARLALAAFLFVSGTGASRLAADSLTFNATKDVSAKEHFPTTNYGTDPILQTSAQATFGKQIFVQFTVSGIPTGATGITAQLKLGSQTDATSRPITAHSVTSTSWGETTLTWNNKPALGAALWTVSTHVAGQDSVWDVSAAVAGNGTFAFGLDTTFSGDTTFASRESSPLPRLVVTYTPAVIGNLSTTPINGTPGFSSSTWQPPPSTHKNDGRVDAILQVGNVVYIGSDADQTWQSGTMRTDMPHLIAYNLATGQLITTWKPAPDGRIYDIKLSADGTKLWVCGQFTTICGTSRPCVAILQALTGSSDTSPATLLNSQLNATPAGGDGTIRSIVLDEPNNRAWLGGSFTTINGTACQGVTKLSKSGTTWSFDPAFNPGSTIDVNAGAGDSAFGVVRTMVLKPDGTKLVVGGDFLWPNPATNFGHMAAFNPATGATMTWNHKFTYDDPTKENPGIFDVAGDANCVYLSGGYNSANITVCTDWNGSGPNLLTPLALNTPKTFNANWFYASDGNNQCMTLGVINGVSVVISGSHGDFVASAKNKNDAGTTGSKIPSGKIYAVTTGASGGILQSYGNPPSFPSPNNSGAPLGPWSFYYNSSTGTLHVGGDFTAVNAETENTHRRYARFDAP